MPLSRRNFTLRYSNALFARASAAANGNRFNAAVAASASQLRW